MAARPRKKAKAGYMISAVAELYKLHPQTLRLYERVGLLKPSRSQGNTRLYTDSDLERLEVILNLTRELGVNLAGIEIILNMRDKMGEMQSQMEAFIKFVRNEVARGFIAGDDRHVRNAIVRPLRATRSASRSSDCWRAASRQDSTSPPKHASPRTLWSAAACRRHAECERLVPIWAVQIRHGAASFACSDHVQSYVAAAATSRRAPPESSDATMLPLISHPRFPQDVAVCTAPSVLALEPRHAYSSDMARADCPICQGSGWKVVERTTEGAQARFEPQRPIRRAGPANRRWSGPFPAIAPRATAPSGRWAAARVPERYRHCDFENFETDNEIEDATPRPTRGLEPQSRAGKTGRAAVSRAEFPVGQRARLALDGPVRRGQDSSRGRGAQGNCPARTQRAFLRLSRACSRRFRTATTPKASRPR